MSAIGSALEPGRWRLSTAEIVRIAPECSKLRDDFNAAVTRCAADHPVDRAFDRGCLRQRRGTFHGCQQSVASYRTAGGRARGNRPRRWTRSPPTVQKRLRRALPRPAQWSAKTNGAALPSPAISSRNAISCDDPDRALLQAGGSDHRRDQRDRLPDQPAGTQCRRGSRPRRRSRQGLCRGRPGSARTGPTLGKRSQGNQHASGKIRNSATEVEARRDAGTGRPARPLHGDRAAIVSRRSTSACGARSPTAAREQAVGLAEVNTAVNQMDQMTQQNAAMVEETDGRQPDVGAGKPRAEKPAADLPPFPPRTGSRTTAGHA